jgi:hypothetical protein
MVDLRSLLPSAGNWLAWRRRASAYTATREPAEASSAEAAAGSAKASMALAKRGLAPRVPDPDVCAVVRAS